VFYQWKGVMVGIHQQKKQQYKDENKNDRNKKCRLRGSHIGLPP
jgi:hypothetical protein